MTGATVRLNTALAGGSVAATGLVYMKGYAQDNNFEFEQQVMYRSENNSKPMEDSQLAPMGSEIAEVDKTLNENGEDEETIILKRPHTWSKNGSHYSTKWEKFKKIKERKQMPDNYLDGLDKPLFDLTEEETNSDKDLFSAALRKGL